MRITTKILLVAFLMIINTGIANVVKRPFYTYEELTVSGTRGAVFYKDEFQQLQRLQDGKTYDRDTWIQVGKSPQSALDVGSYGEVNFEGKFHIASDSYREDGKMYFQSVEGTIYELLSERYGE